MKKQFFLLGACVAVLILLTGALLLLNASPDSDSDSEASAPAALDEASVYITGGADEPLPDSIEVINESGSYSIRKIQENGQDELRIPELDGASQDNYGLASAGESASALKATEIIAENVQDSELKNFGLANPRATARIFYLERSSPATVFFGDNAPGGEGVYAKLATDDTVYLVDSVACEPFFKPMLAYVNKSITATDPDAMGLDRVVISGSEIPEPIIIEKLESDDEEFSFGTHEILSPVSAALDFNARQALISLYGLTATDAVALGGDSETLELYGLATPAVTASVTGPADHPEMSFTLRVSSPDENGNVRVIKSGSDIIYELPELVVPWTQLKLFDYMDKAILMPDINELSAITVTLGDGNYTFALSGESTELAVSLNGKDIDTGEFRTFFQNLTAAEYDAPTDEAVEPDAVPLAELRYSYKNQNRMDTVSFYTGPLRRNLVSLNGGSPYLCVSSYLNGLESDLAALLS